MGYAFISYSSKNQDMISSATKFFSDNNVDIWVAPNNIPAGENYASCISRAIKGCSCFVLLLTEDSQESIWVSKEVERAIHYKKPIISISIKEIELNDEFEFYLSSFQFIKIDKFDLSDKDMKKALTSVLSYAGLKSITKTDFIADNNNLSIKSPDEEYYTLGINYLFGNKLLGIKQDFKQALTYFLKAAKNHPSARYCVGICHEYGLGINKNQKTAKKWYVVSAEQNVTAAFYKLGCFYESEDSEKAFEYYQLAANKGFPPALTALGLFYLTDSKTVSFDTHKGIKYLSQAAEKNNAEAQFELGCYFDTDYIEFVNNKNDNVDYSLAKKWFTLAARQNNSQATALLGDMYYYGRGVKQDYVKAAKLYHLSASQGNKLGCSNISMCYCLGHGVEKNEDLAKMWKDFYKSPEGCEARQKEELNKEFKIIRELPVRITNV